MARRPSPTEIRKTLRPGDPSTGRHLRDWGTRLVCVRHRVDRAKGVRFTTVEIVASKERAASLRREPHPDTLVYARVGPNEWELERRLRTARAATFDPFLNVWRMRYETAVRLRLKRRLLLQKPGQARKTEFSAAKQTLRISSIPAHPKTNIPARFPQDPSEFE